MSARPRIALVVASLDILGGHSVLASTLLGHLRGEGYPVSLIPINPAYPRALRWVRRLPYARTLLTQALYRPSLARLASVDVVHVFAASYWSFLLGPVPAIRAAWRLGKRLVVHYHSGEADDHLGRWGRLVHPFLRRADAIVVPSRYLDDVFARHGHRARVIPNVVDLERFAYRERRPLRPRLLTTRNLEPYYDVGNTLEAFARIRPRFPGATLTVVGRGSEEAALRRRFDAVPGVRFLGRVEPAAMPPVYDGADVFVNSSVVDNQPLSVLEAMAAGLPVVSTPTGDIASLLGHGRAGRLVSRRDPAAMADALAAVFADEAESRAMAVRARDAALAFTWPRVAPEWAAVYAEAGR